MISPTLRLRYLERLEHFDFHEDHTLDHTIRIGSTPICLHFDLYRSKRGSMKASEIDSL